MPRSRTWITLVGPVAVGCSVAVFWVVAAGGWELIRQLLSAEPLGVLAMLAVTATWFFTRFLRSQFLLRRAGVRVPIRPALATYLAALPGTATPAYVGESVRSVFLQRRFGAPWRTTLAVLVLERLYDVAALALLMLALGAGMTRAIAGAFLVASVVAVPILRSIMHHAGMPRAGIDHLHHPWTAVVAMGASLAAWLAAASLYYLGSLSIGTPISLWDGLLVFTRSTLLGALTLSPAGVGVTGSLAIAELTQAGLPLATAVYLVTLVRLTSVGFAMAVGVAFLWREAWGTAPGPERVAHFDTIATEYAAQWSSHVWDLLLDRKLSLMATALPAPPASAGIGLDLGCGLAIQAGEMRRRGYRVIGIEPSIGLLARRANPETPVVAGDALCLPFGNGSIDFVYVVGVLHHLPGRQAQTQALAEIRRVLRPGGTLLVHESNPRNPFFRFYMGYLFPILKSIDEGTEWWIDPREWDKVPGLRLQGTDYFTFLPDFIPRGLLEPALAVERWLERGPTAPYSAHYLAIMRREDSVETGERQQR